MGRGIDKKRQQQNEDLFIFWRLFKLRTSLPKRLKKTFIQKQTVDYENKIYNRDSLFKIARLSISLSIISKSRIKK